MNIFFCVSFYDGDASWIKNLGHRYIVYNKSGKELSGLDSVVNIPNVGYNISSYLKFIVDHYEALPEKIVFCKNNVFPRHVTKEIFFEACDRDVLTPINDEGSWENLSFPVSCLTNSGDFLEVNDSWYASKYKSRFFSDYDEFYKFIFQADYTPFYLSFSPGANYVVPRNNILLRSKSFYENLMTFVSHSQLSCESHFVERSLQAIWTSNIKSAVQMNSVLSTKNLAVLSSQCLKRPRAALFGLRVRRKIFYGIVRFLINLLYANKS